MCGKIPTTILLVIVAILLNPIKSEDENKCDHLGVLLYEDLACTPVTKEGQTCPIKYDCNLTPEVDKCLFKSKNYAASEQVNNNLTYGACQVGCHCYDNKFTCAILDCPEWLGSPVGFGCYRKYELDECCSSGQICEPFDGNIVCKGPDGRNHTEGSRFSADNSCLKCVCKKGFDGKLVAPFCHRPTCAVQIRNSKEVSDHCAPAYFSKEGPLCCPEHFVCPDSDDDIKVIDSKADQSSDLRCKFGEKSLKLGEGLKRTVEKYGQTRKLSCVCQVPPLLTCRISQD